MLFLYLSQPLFLPMQKPDQSGVTETPAAEEYRLLLPQVRPAEVREYLSGQVFQIPVLPLPVSSDLFTFRVL